MTYLYIYFIVNLLLVVAEFFRFILKPTSLIHALKVLLTNLLFGVPVFVLGFCDSYIRTVVRHEIKYLMNSMKRKAE